jgi:tripartite-type tricarboxylate transporter receptor subunit TctC
MKIMGLRAAVIAVTVTIGFAGPDAVHAQSYPARAVTLIVPSAAGGGTDVLIEPSV